MHKHKNVENCSDDNIPAHKDLWDSYESIVSGSEHFRKKLKENLVSGRPVLLSENFKALDLVYLFKNMIKWLTTVICMGKDFW